MNNGVNLSFLLFLDAKQKSPCSCHKAYIHTARIYRLRVLLLLLLELLIRFLKTLFETSDVSFLLTEKKSAFLNDLLSQLC